MGSVRATPESYAAASHTKDENYKNRQQDDNGTQKCKCYSLVSMSVVHMLKLDFSSGQLVRLLARKILALARRLPLLHPAPCWNLHRHAKQ